MTGPRKPREAVHRFVARAAARRRAGLVVGLIGVAVLVQATVVLAGGSARSVSPAVSASTGPVAVAGSSAHVFVGHSYKNDVSPALTTIPAAPLLPVPEREASPNPSVGRHVDARDPVVQHSLAPPSMPAPTLSFDGIPFPGVGCNCAPPDTNGEVGATQYVQIVNEGFQVFNKSTGGSVFGPVGITTLWNGFGGVCQNAGDGDPVVLYDQLANRWVITQFAGSSVPTDECIAVSTTSDATGTWFRYGFHLGSNFFDYPHLGVWPDAYYMSMNVFNSSGTAFLGPQPFAFNRAAMLAGSPATFITTGVTGGSSEETYLPADLDGNTPPPAGAPNSFVEWPSGSPLRYKVFHFHVDFGTPANSSFTLFGTPAAAGFTQLCPTSRSCVPEPNGSRLDAIADRLMFRSAYRNFGDHESLVTNYTVSSGGVAGVRWLELRGVTAGPVSVYQESTYQPDTTWRWMGSAAMDGAGDLAVGFSVSSAAIVPGLRYAGRLAGDPLNQLAQGEATLFAGVGSQTGTSNRWGDYSDLTVDPSRRLHLLVHERVLPVGLDAVQLAHADRELQVPDLRQPAASTTPTTASASAASASASASASTTASATTSASASAWAGQPDHSDERKLQPVLGRDGGDARLGSVLGEGRAHLQDEPGWLRLLGARERCGGRELVRRPPVDHDGQLQHAVRAGERKQGLRRLLCQRVRRNLQRRYR